MPFKIRLKGIFLLLLFIILANGALKALNVRVGLHSLSKADKLAFNSQGPVFIYLSNDTNTRIFSLYQFSVELDSLSMILKVPDTNDSLLSATQLKLVFTSAVQIIASGKKNMLSLSAGDLDVDTKNNEWSIVYTCDVENYVPGVVQSEVGKGKPPEYYAMQSLLCRSYVLGHLRRHETENFNVCDEVHCQVFGGNDMVSPAITTACERTRNQVIVDLEATLITAAFHGNCGGYTSSSEMVWNKALPYLKSVKDTFCVRSYNHRWEKSFEINEWNKALKQFCNSYLDEKDGNLRNKIRKDDLVSRSKFYPYSDCQIQNKDIRQSLQLKSSFFAAEKSGDKIIVHGHGYGHGVGICQDGALEMARQGWAHEKIIHYYYSGVTIINLNDLLYFKSE